MCVLTDCIFIVTCYADTVEVTQLKYPQSLQVQPHVLTLCACKHTHAHALPHHGRTHTHTHARPHTNTCNLRNWQPDICLCCSVNHVGAPFLSSIYAHTCSYLITPCSRALIEKLTCSQLVKKFPAFHVTRRFITAFTSARHLSLPSARSIQSMAPNPIAGRSILIFTSHLCLGLPSGLFLSVLPTKPLYTPLFSPKHAHVAHISFFSISSHEQYLVRSKDH